MHYELMEASKGSQALKRTSYSGSYGDNTRIKHNRLLIENRKATLDVFSSLKKRLTTRAHASPLFTKFHEQQVLQKFLTARLF